MAFMISTLRFFYYLLNTLKMLSSAVYFGFGAYLTISKADVISTGLKEISLILLVSGAAILFLSFMGYCVGSGRRTFLLRIYSFFLLLGAVYQFGLGILVMIRKGKTNNQMNELWSSMGNKKRAAFETAYNCCGYKTVKDRSECSSLKAAAASSCFSHLSSRQDNLLKWMIAGLIMGALISFCLYLVTHWLVSRYVRDRQVYKQQQRERKERKAQNSKNTPYRHFTKNKAGNDAELRDAEEAESIKSVKISEKNGGGLRFLPNFLKPVPKPTIEAKDRQARSVGSMLTYDEIVNKYKDSGK